MYQVSVLVPVYGVDRFIERCARSLFEQTYGNLEYIFVDDCSPDNSMAILKRVMEDYPERKDQVRILRHERNRGLAAARNTALDAANGLFVTHVDSDDYLDRDAIRLLVEKQEETGADIVSGNYCVITDKGIRNAILPEYKDNHEFLLKTFDLRKGIRTIWGHLFKLSLYNDYHIRVKEGVNVGEDWQQIPLLAYYAKTTSKIDSFVYYYDCTNPQSYIHNYQKAVYWKQPMESLFIMESFFSDKEPVYRDASRRLSICKLKELLHIAAKNGNKRVFNDVKILILSNYSDCLDVIGWDNPLNRVFRCNYYLHSSYRRLYEFGKKCFSGKPTCCQAGL